jgi:hypothetical protein
MADCGFVGIVGVKPKPQCGTDRTGFVVTSRDNPQPW